MFSHAPAGRVVGAWDENGRLWAEIDPSGAYEHVKKWTTPVKKEHFIRVRFDVRRK